MFQLSAVLIGTHEVAFEPNLTEQFGILDHLQPSDQILAYCGFNVQESIGLYCAEIKVPAYTKGKQVIRVKKLGGCHPCTRITWVPFLGSEEPSLKLLCSVKLQRTNSSPQAAPKNNSLQLKSRVLANYPESEFMWKE